MRLGVSELLQYVTGNTVRLIDYSVSLYDDLQISLR